MSLALERIAAEPASGSRATALALRYALRELRSGLRGFYVFIACIALGVLAIAGVGSVAASLGDGLAREGRTLLGGDVAFSLIQREAKPDEIAFLRSRGEVSVAATLRSCAACSGKAQRAARAKGEALSLTKATVWAPRAAKLWVGNTRSGLWPDCEKASDSRPSQSSCVPYSVFSDIGSEVTKRPSRAISR